METRYGINQEVGVGFNAYVAQEKRAVVGGVDIESIKYKDDSVVVNHKIPVIWTPHNYAMSVTNDIVGVSPSGKPLTIKKISGLQFEVLRSGEKGRHKVTITPSIQCVGIYKGPTTTISFN